MTKPKSTDNHDKSYMDKATLLIDMLSYARPSRMEDDPMYVEFLSKFIEPVMGQPDEYGNFIHVIKDDEGGFPNVAYMAHHDTVHTKCMDQGDLLFYGKTTPMGEKSSIPKTRRRSIMLYLKKAPMISVETTTKTINKDTGEIISESKVESKRSDPNHKTPSCLGADCTTGIWLILEMIAAGVPGVYVIHAQEEIGRRGAEAIVSDYKSSKGKKYSWISKVDIAISFDRKDVNSIITRQSGSQCCSKEFVDTFSDLISPELQAHGYPKLTADPGGSFTDSYSYIDVIHECTNLSVGYYRQHSSSEEQDIKFAVLLRDALIKHGHTIDDGNTIAVERDCTAKPEISNVTKIHPKNRRGHWGGNSNMANNSHGKGYTPSKATYPNNPQAGKSPQVAEDIPEDSGRHIDWMWGDTAEDWDDWDHDPMGGNTSIDKASSIDNMTFFELATYNPKDEAEEALVIYRMITDYPTLSSQALSGFGGISAMLIDEIFSMSTERTGY